MYFLFYVIKDLLIDWLNLNNKHMVIVFSKFPAIRAHILAFFFATLFKTITNSKYSSSLANNPSHHPVNVTKMIW